jgi:hypothetical protein
MYLLNVGNLGAVHHKETIHHLVWSYCISIISRFKIVTILERLLWGQFCRLCLVNSSANFGFLDVCISHTCSPHS